MTENNQSGVMVTNDNSIYVGRWNNTGNASLSVVLGFICEAGSQGVTIGGDSSSGSQAISIGVANHATGDRSVAIGNANQATGASSAVVGGNDNICAGDGAGMLGSVMGRSTMERAITTSNINDDVRSEGGVLHRSGKGSGVRLYTISDQEGLDVLDMGVIVIRRDGTPFIANLQVLVIHLDSLTDCKASEGYVKVRLEHIEETHRYVLWLYTDNADDRISVVSMYNRMPFFND